MTGSEREQAELVSRRRVLIIGLGGTAAAVLAACGVSSSSGAPGASGAPGGSAPAGSAPAGSAPPATGLRIQIFGDDAVGGTFEPAHLTLRVGDTVMWENVSPLAHHVSCDPGSSSGAEHGHVLPDGAEPFNSAGLIYPGDTFAQAFDVAGDYVYSCTMHEGHVGELTVTG